MEGVGSCFSLAINLIVEQIQIRGEIWHGARDSDDFGEF